MRSRTFRKLTLQELIKLFEVDLIIPDEALLEDAEYRQLVCQICVMSGSLFPHPPVVVNENRIRVPRKRNCA